MFDFPKYSSKNQMNWTQTGNKACSLPCRRYKVMFPCYYRMIQPLFKKYHYLRDLFSRPLYKHQH